MVRRANRKSRRKAVRREKNLVVISTEGKNKTEITYFVEFNRVQKNYKIITAAGNNTDPKNIVLDAIKSAKKENLNLNKGDHVYAIFDTDFGKEDEIREAIQMAKRNQVEVLLSNPCFEIWLLLHFRYSTKGYHSNLEVHNELVDYWPEYKKNIDTYQNINEKLTEAIYNAKKIEKFNIDTYGTAEVLRCNPSTDVYKLVQMLLQNRVEDN